MKFIKLFLTALLLTSFSLPVVAQLPNKKNLIFIGRQQPGTIQDGNLYVIKDSIKPRGRFIFYTGWFVWKTKPNKDIAITKSTEKADCYNWSILIMTMQGFDEKGNSNDSKDVYNKQIDTSPGTIGDKTLQKLCNKK